MLHFGVKTPVHVICGTLVGKEKRLVSSEVAITVALKCRDNPLILTVRTGKDVASAWRR
jgi:hypothetical protein